MTDSLQLFHGVKFFIASLHNDEDRDLLIRNGGNEVKVMVESTTVAINDRSEIDTSDIQLLYLVPVVCSQWIHSSIKAKRMLPFKAFQTNYLNAFVDANICFTQLTLADCRLLAFHVQLRGGKIIGKLDQSVTHLVAGQAKGILYEAALQNSNLLPSLKIVGVDWLIHSIRANTLLPSESYHPSSFCVSIAKRRRNTSGPMFSNRYTQTSPELLPQNSNTSAARIAENKPIRPVTNTDFSLDEQQKIDGLLTSSMYQPTVSTLENSRRLHAWHTTKTAQKPTNTRSDEDMVERNYPTNLYSNMQKFNGSSSNQTAYSNELHPPPPPPSSSSSFSRPSDANRFDSYTPATPYPMQGPIMSSTLTQPPNNNQLYSSSSISTSSAVSSVSGSSHLPVNYPPGAYATPAIVTTQAHCQLASSAAAAAAAAAANRPRTKQVHQTAAGHNKSGGNSRHAIEQAMDEEEKNAIVQRNIQSIFSQQGNWNKNNQGSVSGPTPNSGPLNPSGPGFSNNPPTYNTTPSTSVPGTTAYELPGTPLNIPKGKKSSSSLSKSSKSSNKSKTASGSSSGKSSQPQTLASNKPTTLQTPVVNPDQTSGVMSDPSKTSSPHRVPMNPSDMQQNQQLIRLNPVNNMGSSQMTPMNEPCQPQPQMHPFSGNMPPGFVNMEPMTSPNMVHFQQQGANFNQQKLVPGPNMAQHHHQQQQQQQHVFLPSGNMAFPPGSQPSQSHVPTNQDMMSQQMQRDYIPSTHVYVHPHGPMRGGGLSPVVTKHPGMAPQGNIPTSQQQQQQQHQQQQQQQQQYMMEQQRQSLMSSQNQPHATHMGNYMPTPGGNQGPNPPPSVVGGGSIVETNESHNNILSPIKKNDNPNQMTVAAPNMQLTPTRRAGSSSDSTTSAGPQSIDTSLHPQGPAQHSIPNMSQNDNHQPPPPFRYPMEARPTGVPPMSNPMSMQVRGKGPMHHMPTSSGSGLMMPSVGVPMTSVHLGGPPPPDNNVFYSNTNNQSLQPIQGNSMPQMQHSSQFATANMPGHAPYLTAPGPNPMIRHSGMLLTTLPPPGHPHPQQGPGGHIIMPSNNGPPMSNPGHMMTPQGNVARFHPRHMFSTGPPPSNAIIGGNPNVMFNSPGPGHHQSIGMRPGGPMPSPMGPGMTMMPGSGQMHHPPPSMVQMATPTTHHNYPYFTSVLESQPPMGLVSQQQLQKAFGSPIRYVPFRPFHLESAPFLGCIFVFVCGIRNLDNVFPQLNSDKTAAVNNNSSHSTTTAAATTVNACASTTIKSEPNLSVFESSENSKAFTNSEEIKSTQEFPISFTSTELEGWECTIRLHGGDVLPMTLVRDCPLDQEPWLSVTHVVFTSSLVQDVDFFQKALMSKKRIISHFWLIDVIKKGILDIPWEINHLPCSFMKHITYSVIADQRLGITGFSPTEVKSISLITNQIGIPLTNTFSSKNTFLLCKKGEGSKYNFAQERGIQCVNMRWLQDLYLGHAYLVNHLNRSLDNKYKITEGTDYSSANVLALDRTTEKARRFLAPWMEPVRINERAWMVFQRSLEERNREIIKRKRVLNDNNSVHVDDENVDLQIKKQFFPFDQLTKEECEIARQSRLRHAEPWLVHQISIDTLAPPPPPNVVSSGGPMDQQMYQRPRSHVSTTDESSQQSTSAFLQSTSGGGVTMETTFATRPTTTTTAAVANNFNEYHPVDHMESTTQQQHQQQTAAVFQEDVWTTDKPPFGPPIIAMSGGLSQLQRSYLRDMIEELGGYEASPDDERCEKCTHLVALHLRRTPKIYHAIILGRHIVSPKWIQASYLRGAWIDEEYWTLKDDVAEKMFGVCLFDSLRRSRERIRLRQGGLFSGLEFWLSTEALHRDKCMELIRASGGQIRDRRPTQKLALMPQPKQFIICNESEVTVAQYLTRTKTGNRAVHHEEFVLGGVMRQEIDYDSYQIQHVSAFNQQLAAILEGKFNSNEKNMPQNCDKAAVKSDCMNYLTHTTTITTTATTNIITTTTTTPCDTLLPLSPLAAATTTTTITPPPQALPPAPPFSAAASTPYAAVKRENILDMSDTLFDKDDFNLSQISSSEENRITFESMKMDTCPSNEDESGKLDLFDNECLEEKALIKTEPNGPVYEVMESDVVYDSDDAHSLNAQSLESSAQESTAPMVDYQHADGTHLISFSSSLTQNPPLAIYEENSPLEELNSSSLNQEEEIVNEELQEPQQEISETTTDLGPEPMDSEITDNNSESLVEDSSGI